MCRPLEMIRKGNDPVVIGTLVQEHGRGTENRGISRYYRPGADRFPNTIRPSCKLPGTARNPVHKPYSASSDIEVLQTFSEQEQLHAGKKCKHSSCNGSVVRVMFL